MEITESNQIEKQTKTTPIQNKLQSHKDLKVWYKII